MISAPKRRLQLAIVALGAAWFCLAPQGFAQTTAKAGAATVTVTVKNVASDEGAVLGQLCADTSAFGTPNCAGINAMTKAAKGEVVLTFTDVPAGTYALAVFHDENSDFQLSVMNEPMAFGNGAMDLPPTFSGAALKISGDLKTETTLFKIGG